MKTFKQLFFIILSLGFLLYLLGCEREWNNPFDEKSGIDPESWAPINFTLTVNAAGSITLAWQQSFQNIEGFHIDRKKENEAWQTGIATVDKSQKTYTDEDVDISAYYYYRVYAFASSKTSSYTHAEPGLPAISTAEISNVTATSAIIGGNINSSGGFSVTMRGVVWSTSQNPTTNTNSGMTNNGVGSGIFTSNLSSLSGNTTYYVRAYATNAAGTAYGNQVEFKTSIPCVGNVTFHYKGQQVTYGTVSRGGLCWMDRNLGATRVPTSSADTQGYGDLFQWGRLDDRHQSRTSSVISNVSSTDNPGHNKYIAVNSGSPWDWRDPQNNNLWQGINGINNPCPVGWRLPTEEELNAERLSWSSNNSAGAYASTLKWPVGGLRGSTLSCSIGGDGNFGSIWSSTTLNTSSRYMSYGPTYSYIGSYSRATGASVRCVRN